MRILTRYVLREFCVPLAYCLTGFLSIYVLFELFGSFSRLMDSQAPFGSIARYFAGYLAPYFQYVAPASLMLATLYTMWNFCRHSELVAMRASGIGFFAIVKPLLFVALLMAAFVAWVNECYSPQNGPWARRFRDARFRAERMEHADNIVFRNAAGDRTWNVGVMMTDDARVLEDVGVTVAGPGGGPKMKIQADRAEFADGEWLFMNARVRYYDAHGAEMPSPTPALEKLAVRTFPGVDEKPRDFVLQNRDSAYYSTQDRRRYLATHPLLPEKDRREHGFKIWWQLLSPLSCLVITLFAIPAGIATGRQSVFRGVVTALVTFFAYYAVKIAFMVFANLGWCPIVLAAVLPDAAFLAVGCETFRRHR